MRFITTATALFAGLVAAAPGQDHGHGVKYVTLTYIAPDGTYTTVVPINGGPVDIASVLSFSHIASSDPTDSATCISYGIDKDPTGAIVTTTLHGDDYEDVGPPQVQDYVVCYS